MVYSQKILAVLVYISIALFVPVSAFALKSIAADDLEFVRLALKDPSVRDVTIPEGSYKINKPIVVNRSGVSLIGRGKVIITLADHSNSPLLILGNTQTPPRPVSDLKVENLILRGNRENQDMECWAGPCDSGGETYIRNNGITIRGVLGAMIKNVQTLGMRSGGVVTEKVCTHLHIDGLISKDNYFDGFAGYETTQSVFRNLDLSENLGAGISLDIRFHGNTFENVLMRKDMDVGVFMRDSNGNKFASLKIIDSGSHAVFVSQVDNQVGTVPNNNTFENLYVEGAKGNGFHLNNASVGNKLIHPKFRNVRGQDIYESVPGFLQVSCGEALNLVRF